MKYLKILLALFISYLPGFVGMLFSPGSGGDMWYATLNRSVLTPDGWVFAVVWNILYALLGIALYLIISNKKVFGEKGGQPLVWFGIHLFLNALWTYVFFGLHMIAVGLVIIGLLMLVAQKMMRVFMRKNKSAGYLVLPYLLWLCFAFYLNAVILCLN